MRVVTFNVLHGRAPQDGRVDLDRFAAAVRELDADLLALQEVDRDQPRSGHADLTAVAAAAMGTRDARFAAALAGGPDTSWRAATEHDVAGPAYGVALLSRHPVRDWRVLRLAAPPVPVPFVPPGLRRPVLGRDEPRVALLATVELPGGEARVAATHLSFVPGWNRRQLRRVLCALGPGRALLLGDLNIAGRLPRSLRAWQPLGVQPTFPAPAPRWQLDHVLARGGWPPVRAVSAPRLALSDHRPLVVDL